MNPTAVDESGSQTSVSTRRDRGTSQPWHSCSGSTSSWLSSAWCAGSRRAWHEVVLSRQRPIVLLRGDPEHRNVEAAEADPSSLLRLYRSLLSLRRSLRGDFEVIVVEAGVLAYRRGHHVVTLNFGDEPRQAVGEGAVVLNTDPCQRHPIAPARGAVVLRKENSKTS